MLEILLFLYRTSRAEAPLFLFYAAAHPCFSKAVGDLFFAIHKTRTHPAETEPGRFLSLHDLVLRLFIAFATTYRVSAIAGIAGRTLLIGIKYSFFNLTLPYGIMPEHSRLIFCLACAVLVIFSCMAAGCYSSPAPSATTTPPASTGGGNSITLKNFAFDPPTLTVKTGTVVTWVNDDGATHTIVSDAGSPAAFSSDPLSPGAFYSFTFTQPGMYPYHCSIHPSMKGTILVQ
jgi:plastocyanin